MRTSWAAALLAASSIAGAADPRCPVSLPQGELNACYERIADDAQERLNRLLQEVRRTVTDKNWSMLRESHDLWTQSRDLDCKVKATLVDRPVRDAVYSGCREKRTRERMRQVSYYLCPRYDLTGVCDAAKEYE
jgi:uncharacterized protein YecT (DUF1311 family)